MQSMDVGTAVDFLRRLRKSYVNGRRLRSRRQSIEPTYLREYLRRDSEHACACAVRSAMHLHGITLHYNRTCPLSCYFEFRGLTPAHLRYTGVHMGASAL